MWLEKSTQNKVQEVAQVNSYMRMRNVMDRQFINSAKINDDVGKIELWGDVYEEVPFDFWTGKPAEGDFITYAKFKDAMESVKDCSKVELHLNSYGGDATVGLTIANLIKSSNQHIIGVNDGICASAGMTILSACDEVRTHKSSLFMIHQTMGFCFGFYNNEELTKIMDCNSSYDSAAAEVYSSRTGLSKNQCLNMMKKTTWMTGVEALEKGFADALVAEEEENKSPVELVNKSTMRINGVDHKIDMFNLSDDFVTQAQRNVATISSLGGNGKMAKDKEDLKDKLFNSIASIFASNSAENSEEESEQPAEAGAEEGQEGTEAPAEQPSENKTEVNEEELTEKINAAVKAERERIQSIQKISDGIDADLVNEAMFGETACDAGELALRSMAKEKEKQAQALQNLQQDAKDSKVNDVSSEPGEIQMEEKPANDKAAIQQAVKNLKAKIKEGK